ncbi:TolC family protein [Pseudocnuella soli]|uniref:TolC family protein n=1 Tax=Pseudocnuella soli TaxID=2502779 RepID=UPI0010440698|nr:TolC family protein [Pseudocnuella soli]
MSLLKRGILYAWVILWGGSLCAQDSLRISLPGAEKLFLQNNLYILAAQFDIEQQQALEVQAKLYPNPVVSAELNLTSSENNKVLRVGNSGQKMFAVEQLLLLGGKRAHAVAMARTSTDLANQSFQDLLRNLKLQLSTNYYGVLFDLRTLSKYDLQLQQLDTLISLYEVQARQGNVALRDVVRLKTAYIDISNDKAQLMQGVQQQQRNLQLLLHTDAVIVPDFPGVQPEQYTNLPSLDSLFSLAYQNRSDWKMAALQQDLAGINTRYQRSLAVPDLSVGAVYDQQGGAFRNQVNLTLGLPLPLWNRNQGNIKAAAIQQQLFANEKAMRQAAIRAEVQEAWRNMQRSIQEYHKIHSLYTDDFNTVLNGMGENFRKRNISLVEFIDFFESYSESMAGVSQVRKQLLLAAEQINYAIALPIYQ